MSRAYNSQDTPIILFLKGALPIPLVIRFGAVLLIGGILFAFIACSPEKVAPPPSVHPGVFVEVKSNPLLRGMPGAWDESSLESPMVIKVKDTYYMYYHATGSRSYYQIGLATAPSPVGPWTRFSGSPVLTPGEKGSWDDQGVGIGHVMKEGDKYLMWYMGKGYGDKERWPWWRWEGWRYWRPWYQWRPWRTWEQKAPWLIGLATASNPEGPWQRYPGNPILSLGRPGSWDSDSLYLGSALKVRDRYYLWYVGFKEGNEVDGKLGLATAASPEGPWVKYPGNPVLVPGPPGSWDDGQIGETAIAFLDNVFYAWYAGYTRQGYQWGEIGYAYSRDGINWTKFAGNPVATRGKAGTWNQDRLSEPHVLIEDRIVYLFYTGTRRLEGKAEEALGVSITPLEVFPPRS